jgi:CRP-like cAMP-binding protein
VDARRSQVKHPFREQRLIEGVLAATPYFSELGSPQIAAMALQCKTLAARGGDAVALRGRLLPGVFAVAYGSLKLAMRGAGGEERVIRLVQAGQTFGEPSALLGRPATYEARALVECRLVIIPVDVLFGLMERCPRIARQVVLHLAERTVSLLDELESSSMLSSGQRLARYLGTLGGEHGAVQLPASKTVVAARLGVKKETLSRLLRAFAERGVITVARREIAILDRAALKQLAA